MLVPKVLASLTISVAMMAASASCQNNQPATPDDNNANAACVVYSAPPETPPAGHYAIWMDAHLYDNYHPDGNALGEEVVGLKDVNVTVDALANDGKDAGVAMYNQRTKALSPTPYTYSACAPVHDEQIISDQISHVSWTVTIDTLPEGYTLTCAVKTLTSNLITSADHVTAIGHKLTYPYVTCTWPTPL